MVARMATGSDLQEMAVAPEVGATATGLVAAGVAYTVQALSSNGGPASTADMAYPRIVKTTGGGKTTSPSDSARRFGPR